MSMTTHVLSIRKATDDDRSAIDATLAQAFFDDPVYAWVIPDVTRRAEILADVFEVFRAAIGRHDEILTTKDNEAVALWVPAGEQVVEQEHADAFGEQLAALLGPDIDRFSIVSDLLDAHHPDEPSFYLNFLAVRPELQGRGVGSGLLAPVLARCDRSGVAAYLAATSERNARLYERHGFEVREELVLPHGPSLWPMWREPMSG